MQFAGLDKRGDGCPVLRPLIVAGEERVLPIEHNGTHASLDDVGVEFDAAVFEEANEPVPMVQAVADGFGDDGLRRDARELLFEPGSTSGLLFSWRTARRSSADLPRIVFSIA